MMKLELEQEIKSITYNQAIKRADKIGDAYLYTYVKWCKKLEVPKKVALKSVGEIDLILPPKLPRGYMMEPHPSWYEVGDLLMDAAKTQGYDFEFIDRVRQDILALHKLLDYDIDPCGELLDPIPKAYWDWDWSFDESWNHLEYLKKALEKEVLKQLGLRGKCSTCEHINREIAPKLETYIEVLVKLSKDEHLIERIEADYGKLH